MTTRVERGEWDSNPWAMLGESIVFVKNSYGQTIKFLERMTIIGSNVMKLFLASVLTTSSR